MRAKSFAKAFCACALYIFLLERPALAYIDPHVGSYVAQVLFAGILTAGACVGLFFSRIESFFTGAKRQKENKENNENGY